MKRTRLFVLAAMPLAILAVAERTTSQAASAPSQDRVPLDATPVDHMTWGGDAQLVREVRTRMTDATRTEKARAEADVDNTPSVAYLRAVRAIWEDDRLRDAPVIVEAGRAIIDAHTHRHDANRRYDASVEVLAVIDANRERWLAVAGAEPMRGHMARWIDAHTATILSGMQGAAGHGRPHIELAALERLIAMEADDHVRQNLIEQRDDLRERMAAGLYGPEGE